MIPQAICASATLCALIYTLPHFKEVKTQRFAMSKEHELALSQDCEEMNSEGKIQNLIQQLNAKSDELSQLELNTDTDLDQNAERINELKINIQQITSKAKSILRSDWTESKWQYKIAWNIDFKSAIKIDPRIIKNNFSFESFELSGVNLGGYEREDLYPLIVTTIDKQTIHVEIEKKASSLELCQLLPSFSIRGIVKYNFRGKHKEKKSLLSLRPGAIYLTESKPEPALPNENIVPQENNKDLIK